MTIRQKLEKLVSVKNGPCVTVSMNTHRTHPDYARDVILLKNLLKEAEGRLIKEFGKRNIAPLLEKLSKVESGFEKSNNLDSLHIYLSNDISEMIKTTWPVNENAVHISDSFSVRPLIKAYNRSENYLIMLLSQNGVHLYEAINESITSEITGNGFPFDENPHYIVNTEKRSDSRQMDNMVREFLNNVDKALVKVYNQSGLSCVVVCTEDNYSRLMQVADKPGAYMGLAKINYNDFRPHTIAKQGYEIVENLQQKKRTEAIAEMKEAVAQGKVITDLQEIFRAAIDGRGDLLIVHQDFSQAVIMKDERTFQLTTDSVQPNAIDDITSIIAWNVLSKKGRVVFTNQEQIKDLGKIVLKTRY